MSCTKLVSIRRSSVLSLALEQDFLGNERKRLLSERQDTVCASMFDTERGELSSSLFQKRKAAVGPGTNHIKLFTAVIYEFSQ
jgi:hypothetical protein